MAIFGFALGALLSVLGLVCLYFALNLVPTDMGMLYAVCGVILVGCGAIVLTIGALIQRIGQLTPATPGLTATPASPQEPPGEIDQSESAPETWTSNAPPPPTQPTPPRPQPAETTPQAQVVGRYTSASGAYVVYSDGAVEAETREGAFRFASLDDFKTYVASRNG